MSKAFTADDAAEAPLVVPLARTLLGKQVGDVVVLRAPRSEHELGVMRMEYETEAS
jgi:transcription elongation GreA/GreB family factor